SSHTTFPTAPGPLASYPHAPANLSSTINPCPPGNAGERGPRGRGGSGLASETSTRNPSRPRRRTNSS
ncbi:hypothetical protein, partial [Streptomyces bikiniensis]|uniref:hypothetical protein n=1 Tax=Streptomyces bikiniensis TaxID=1896 RepID=UPI001AE0935B